MRCALAMECANAMGKDTMHSLSSFSSEIASIHDNDTMKTHGWGDGLDAFKIYKFHVEPILPFPSHSSESCCAAFHWASRIASGDSTRLSLAQRSALQFSSFSHHRNRTWKLMIESR